jgi:hypothetical protein
MNKKYTFTMVVVKPTGKGGKPLKPKPIKPLNKSWKINQLTRFFIKEKEVLKN